MNLMKQIGLQYFAAVLAPDAVWYLDGVAVATYYEGFGEIRTPATSISSVVVSGSTVTVTAAGVLYSSSNGTGSSTRSYTYEEEIESATAEIDGTAVRVYAISKQGGDDMSRISIDLKSIDAIKPGTHSITVKASADGYKDSEFSEAVSYTKGISFSIDGTTYWAYDDSTWAEWCADSTVNPNGFKVVDGKVYTADESSYVIFTSAVSSDIAIVEGTSYGLESAETAVGTWLLNETLSRADFDCRVDGSFYWSYGSADLAQRDISYIYISTPESYPDNSRLYLSSPYVETNTYYVKHSGDTTLITPDDYSLSYDYIASEYFESGEYGSYARYEKTSPEGIKMRTITITGGTDATNADLITWLKANAVKQ